MAAKTNINEAGPASYNINVIGRHISVTDAMKAYAREKIAKLDRISNRILDVHVNMDIQRGEHRVDFIIWVENTKIKVTGISNSMYASVDAAIDKLKYKLSRYLARLHEHHARGGKVVPLNVSVIRLSPEEELADINAEIEEENQHHIEEKYRPHHIVSKETTHLKSLTYNEAMMKMELSDDPFLLFRCEEDQKLKVIYRREDEDYGVIEVE